MQWIKTSDRLPEEKVKIIFFVKNNLIEKWYCGYLVSNIFYEDKNPFFKVIEAEDCGDHFKLDYVQYWMIPELPEDL